MLVYKGKVKGYGSIGVATSLRGADVFFFDLFSFEQSKKEIVVGDKIELEEWYICLPAKSLKLAIRLAEEENKTSNGT